MLEMFKMKNLYIDISPNLILMSDNNQIETLFIYATSAVVSLLSSLLSAV